MRDEEKRTIVFLLTHIPDPRINKRIELLKKYYNIVVICARREKQDCYEPVFNDVIYEILDINLPSSKKMIKRFFASRRFQAFISKAIKMYNPYLLYVGSLDCLEIAHKKKKQEPSLKVFYEIADLREAYIDKTRSIIKKCFYCFIRRIEKKYLSNIDYLVLTSMKFYDYYSGFINADKVVYMPNIPNPDFFSSYSKKKKGCFTIGFIGGLRYIDQMKMLVEATKDIDVKVIFAGVGDSSTYEKMKDYCSNFDNVTFLGRYNYEADIAKLYGMVDCVYSVYNADNPNVCIALPNKLYESILCELPIIVAKNTYLAELVDKMGVGLAVNHKDVCELRNTILSLKNDIKLVESIVSNCKKAKEINNMNTYNKILLEKVVQ